MIGAARHVRPRAALPVRCVPVQWVSVMHEMLPARLNQAGVILCVEDEPTLLSDLCDELRGAGYEVIGVPDVPQARQVLARVMPALIVCDIQLPGPSGLEFMAQVRADEALCEIPFMLLTAQTGRDHVLRGKREGADDYLPKPVDYDLLLASVESRLAQVRRMHSSFRTQMQQRSDALLQHWTAVLDKVSHCALICDAALGVRFANRAAFSLYRSAEDGLLVLSPTGQIGLHPHITGHAGVLAFLHGDADSAKVEISSNGQGDRRTTWQISLLALNERTPGWQRNGVGDVTRDTSFVVFLSDLRQRQLHNQGALARRFSLTPTELQVASLLTDGLTKQEMCERLEVSASTMSYHLRNLFSKTETNRQAELVALLMAVAWNDISLTPSARI